MGKHFRPIRCTWCTKTFETLRDAKQHEDRKHHRNMVRCEDDDQRAQLQHYHQDRVA